MFCERYVRVRVSLVVVILAASLRLAAQTPATIADQLSTAEHLKKAGWWPTKGNMPRSEYVGTQVCAACHSDIAATQKQSHMAQTAMEAQRSDQLQGRQTVTFHLGPYTYKIARSGSRESYSVSNGSQTIDELLTWAFGAAGNGQSYLFSHSGKLYEARLAYYRSEDNFDITPNHPTTPAPSLEEAIGRHISSDEAPKCFGCHTTASAVSGKFEPEQAIPGITCEQCHGPGAAHVAAHRSGLGDSGIGGEFNPTRLSPPEAVDFCGTCHRTWWDVTLDGLTGVGTVRFPAYRLEKSRCWGKGDARITCMACHDPHKPLVKDSAAYDAKCLSCHRSSSVAALNNHPGPACKVGQSDCASCHMPKYQIPEMHTKFTDHMIRVVRKDEVLPQ